MHLTKCKTMFTTTKNIDGVEKTFLCCVSVAETTDPEMLKHCNGTKRLSVHMECGDYDEPEQAGHTIDLLMDLNDIGLFKGSESRVFRFFDNIDAGLGVIVWELYKEKHRTADRTLHPYFQVDGVLFCIASIRSNDASFFVNHGADLFRELLDALVTIVTEHLSDIIGRNCAMNEQCLFAYFGVKNAWWLQDKDNAFWKETMKADRKWLRAFRKAGALVINGRKYGILEEGGYLAVFGTHEKRL